MQHIALDSPQFKVSLRELYNYINHQYTKKTLTSTDSPYTVSSEDNLLLINAVSGNINILLNTVSGYQGMYLIIKRIDASGNTCTITADGSDLIDGAGTKTLAQWETARLWCDGSATWFSI